MKKFENRFFISARFLGGVPLKYFRKFYRIKKIFKKIQPFPAKTGKIQKEQSEMNKSLILKFKTFLNLISYDHN